jgi:hypothetical protein
VPSSNRFPGRLRLSWCLLPLLTSCAAPAPTATRPDPPPPSLAAECWAGPEYPAGDVPLLELLQVVAEREVAAAECRARHKGLVDAWPR